MKNFVFDKLLITTLNNQKIYYYHFKAFEEVGIYKFNVIFKKPNFYMKPLEKEIVIKYQ